MGATWWVGSSERNLGAACRGPAALCPALWAAPEARTHASRRARDLGGPRRWPAARAAAASGRLGVGTSPLPSARACCPACAGSRRGLRTSLRCLGSPSSATRSRLPWICGAGRLPGGWAGRLPGGWAGGARQVWGLGSALQGCFEGCRTRPRACLLCRPAPARLPQAAPPPQIEEGGGPDGEDDGREDGSDPRVSGGGEQDGKERVDEGGGAGREVVPGRAPAPEAPIRPLLVDLYTDLVSVRCAREEGHREGSAAGCCRRGLRRAPARRAPRPQTWPPTRTPASLPPTVPPAAQRPGV